MDFSSSNTQNMWIREKCQQNQKNQTNIQAKKKTKRKKIVMWTEKLYINYDNYNQNNQKWKKWNER